ncbi:unnamed protein product [Prorocentrum cordatum]|uniref:Reverse transcriptase Ty1/copia-type domain-containing protein n=1 Tax=Prorocentrum cordatum TaxID=2364126 RepID=A0ABN9RK41_9DINO|nr:unnamed protein product [Polarella glacialis]
MAGLVDTRLLGRPNKYSGNRDEFPTFRYQLISYLGAIGPRLAQAVTTAATHGNVITLSEMGDDNKQFAATMGYTLSQLLGGSALTLVMNCEPGNGLEQWRRLCLREDAATGSNKVTQLQLLVNTEFSGKWETYVEEFTKFLLDMNRYQEKFSEVISDTLVQALIKKNTPEPLKTQVMMQTFTNHQILRETCEAFAQQMMQRDPRLTKKKFDPNAMDVDAFDKGGKGDSKGKGFGGKSDQKGSGGKSSSQRSAWQSSGGKGGKGDGKNKMKSKKGETKLFDGWCSNPHCGKYGHKIAEVSDPFLRSSQDFNQLQDRAQQVRSIQEIQRHRHEYVELDAYRQQYYQMTKGAMTEKCKLTGEPGQSLRSITGKGIRTWDKRTLTGEVFDSNTSIPAKLDVTPAEVRRGALSVAEMNDAGYSVHFDPDGAKMFKSNKNVQHEIDKAIESTVTLRLRRKVNAFLLPMRFKDPTGYESIIGDVEDHSEKDDEQMKEEPVETQPVEVQDRRTGYLMGVVVEAKGNQSYAIAAISEYLDELGYMSMEVQLDGEPALEALMNGVISERIKKLGKEAAEAQLRVRLVPKGSHASQGGVESGVKSVAGLARTGRLALEKRYNMKFTEDVPIIPWMIRHQIFCHNRYQRRRSSGRTSFEELRLAPYTSPMLEFGETVIGKEHTELQDKLGTAWCKGLWLGRSSKSDAHLIGTATGVVQARTVKQLTTEESFDMEMLKAMRWTPWRTSVRAGVYEGENWQPTEGAADADLGEGGPGGPPGNRGLVGAIESLSTGDLKRLVAGFSTEEMLRLVGEVDKELKDDSEFSIVMGWTEDDEWEAKQCELDRFDNYNVWELTLRDPHGPKALTWTWVLEMRSGELKARLCARPFGKQVNKSKNELYCPTPLSFSLKLLMVYAIVKDFAIFFFDISRAFLYTPIRELVCAEVPKEYCHLPDGSDWVFKLNKTVYGLNEAMIDFDDHFENIATGRNDESKMTFKRFLSDPCTFADKANQVAMSKHVDDGTLVGPRVSASKVLEELGTHFLLKVSELTVGGPEIKHLGRGWLRTPEGIQVRMWPAIVKKLLDSEPNDKKTSPIPGVKNEKKVESEEELDSKAATKFRSVNGLNMFVCLERPECQYAAKECSRGMSRPTVQDQTRLTRIIRFIRAHPSSVTCMYPDSGEFKVIGRADSNWAEDPIKRKSTSCGQLFLNGALIMQFVRTQGAPALSSPEAEFNALVHDGIEARGAQTYLKELLDETVPATLESDNSSALTNVEKKGVGRMRHIELKDLWIKDLVARKAETKVSTSKVHTNENTADLGTKHLSRVDFMKHLTAMKVWLTGKGEVGGISGSSNEKKGQIGKPALELMGALTQCLVGLGTFLQFGRADATELGEKEFQPVAIWSPADDESHFGVSTTVVMMMLTLLSVVATSAVFKVKQHIDRITQPARKDASTQYSLKDTMKNGATSKIVVNDLRAMFTAMTIDSGREFLRLRRVDRAVSTYTKAMVVEACVATALNEIRQDKIYSVDGFVGIWHPHSLAMIRY